MMTASKLRKSGEKYRPVATVLKTKEGVPTRVEIGGNEYFMINPAQDKKNHFSNAKARRAEKRKSLQNKYKKDES